MKKKLHRKYVIRMQRQIKPPTDIQILKYLDIDGQKTHPKSFSAHHTVRCGFDSLAPT